MKDNCTRYGAGGCQGDGGETCRSCTARAMADILSDMEEGEKALRRSLLETRIFGVVATIIALAAFGFAAHYGLGRAEQNYQMEARV